MKRKVQARRHRTPGSSERYQTSSTYMPQHSQIGNREHSERRSRGQTLLRGLFVLGILLFGGFFLYGGGDPIIRIAEGARPSSEIDVYRSSVDEIISSSVFNNSKLTLNYRGVGDALKARHPEISEVSISFALIGNRPVVRLDFYAPALVSESPDGTRWIVDSRGVAVSKVDTTSADRLSDLEQVRDEIGLVSMQGDRLLSEADVRFISSVSEAFGEKGKDVEKTTIPPRPRELVFKLSEYPFSVRMILDAEPRQQVGTALAAIETLKAANTLPLEYLDVRPGEKVYWR